MRLEHCVTESGMAPPARAGSAASAGRWMIFVTDVQLYPMVSGNRMRILSFIRVLRELGLKVALVAPANLAPAEQLRWMVDDFFPVPGRPFCGGRMAGFNVAPFRYAVDKMLERVVAKGGASTLPVAAVAQYAWLGASLAGLPPGVSRWIDCHDLLHERTERFSVLGLDPWASCTWEEEKRCLESSDGVIATQEREAALLRELLPAKRVECILTPAELPRGFLPSRAGGKIVLTVGAKHPGNFAVDDFVREGWPRVLDRVPGAELHIVGTIGGAVRSAQGVRKFGWVKDLRPYYDAASVVVCPVETGTGVKTKLLEAMRYGKAVVATRAAAEGIPAPQEAWSLVDSVAGCADAIVELLGDSDRRRALETAGFEFAAEAASPESFRVQIGRALLGEQAGVVGMRAGSCDESAVSVILMENGNLDRLRICLQALWNQAYPRERFEIIVVARSFGPVRAAAIGEEFPGVKVVRAPGLNAAEARDCGARYARYGLKEYLDCDARQDSDWLARAVTRGQDKGPQVADVASAAGSDVLGDALGLGSIAVIVPSLGWPHSLDACLRSIREQVIGVPVETIVVLNGPEPVTDLRCPPGVRVVREPMPGPAAARNAGVRAASADVLAFIDSDCVAKPLWLASALAAMREGAADHIIAGPIARPPRGQDGRSWVALYDRVNYLRQDVYVEGGHGFVTANLIVHRETFARVGPFDTLFHEAANEDFDWAERARRLGVQVTYASSATVVHECMTRMSQLRSKAERLARGALLTDGKAGRPLLARGLWRRLREEIRRAGRQGLSPQELFAIVAVGTVAAYAAWRAQVKFMVAAGRRQPMAQDGEGVA